MATSVDLLQDSAVKSISGLYIHIPFCFHKCHYCDFYSIVETSGRQEHFLERMLSEWRSVRGRWPGGLRTIFVGGGTPTLLPATLWRRLLEGLGRDLDFSTLDEFTVEANPETVDRPLLSVLVRGGVGRLSIGCQSFDSKHLQTLERKHDPRSVGRAVALAREAGIGRINLDLIFAIPGQSLEDWKRDLDRTIELQPDHISCYGLTYEPNTPMTQKLHRGRIRPAEQELEAAMFEWAIDRLEEAGFRQYEISNFARPGAECLHNLLYWTNGDWFALGPGAAGHLGGVRWKNVPHLGRYLATEGGCPVQETERLDEQGRIGERLMLGLRLREGLEMSQTQLGPERQRKVERWIGRGWMARSGDRIRLTPEGMLQADSILADLI
ncbi:MAG: radical SAM family heme chaperone HemW [Phycisphaeraceae bacterium]|nr:radical SAM family heme chaperone HemW [Phycisphaeraceae bacterium]